MELSLSLWWPLLAIGACADRRDALGRVSAEDARRLVTDGDRAWLGYGYGAGGYGSGCGDGGGGGGGVYGDGGGGCDGSGSGGSSSSGDGDGDGYGVGSGGRSDGSSDGSGDGCCDGSGSGSRSSDGSGIVSLTIDGVRRTPDEVRIWLIEMATASPEAATAWEREPWS